MEPAGHMVKPCPGKTKEILKSSPAHCPPNPHPLKMSIVLLPCPVTDLFGGTSLRALTLKCITCKRKKMKMSTQPRGVSRETVLIAPKQISNKLQRNS